MPRRAPMRLLALVTPALLAASAPALSFNLTFTTESTPQVINSFNRAAARWSALLLDPISVNLNVGLASLPNNVIASTGSARVSVSYANLRNALVADATTGDDALAIAGLQAGPGLSITANYFTDNPNGNNSSSFTTTVSSLSVNRANAKALGLVAANSTTQDGLINFATAFQNEYDYNPDDGITAGLLDFEGVAVHEIGHALGFVSGVDSVDNPGFTNGRSSTASAFVSPLDLFRRGGVSTQPNLTASNQARYFSLDNGTTNSGLFSLGAARGDGQQASHWKDNLGLGIMDPTASDGELLSISARDLRAFDVIGYNPVPEPATMAALGLGALALLRRRRKI